jgi:hypothetical protein
VGAPAVLIRLISLSPHAAVVHNAIVASIAMLYVRLRGSTVHSSLWGISFVCSKAISVTFTGSGRTFVCAARYPRYGGNDAVQASFFAEFHNLQDVSFFQVLFNKITAASESLLVAVKEVGCVELDCVSAAVFSGARRLAVHADGSGPLVTLTNPQRKRLLEAASKSGLRPRADQGKTVSIIAELKLLQQLCEGHVLERQVCAR